MYRKFIDKQNKEITIRPVSAADAEQLAEIYAPYVKNTAITFEYDAPSAGEFTRRISHTLETYPYLAAEAEGKILGYGYAGPLKERAAYDRSCEMSIYIRQDQKRRGIGRVLYGTLEECLKAQNILNLYACISYPEKEDEYLSLDSVWFHEHMGYRLIGRFHQCGYKFGRWYDMIWMEKFIGDHIDKPLEVKKYPELQKWI